MRDGYFYCTIYIFGKYFLTAINSQVQRMKGKVRAGSPSGSRSNSKPAVTGTVTMAEKIPVSSVFFGFLSNIRLTAIIVKTAL